MTTKKALILAAGFGTRLRPFTEWTPKPLIPFFGVRLLDLALLKLREAGFDDLVVNAHHLHKKIEEAVALSPLGKGVFVSVEMPEILGRGGVFLPIATWRGSSDVLVYNGDIVSDIQVGELIKVYNQSSMTAAMTLLPKALPRDGKVYCDHGKIIAISKTPPNQFYNSEHGFACMHILSDRFIKLLPSTVPSDVLDAYREAFAQKMPVGSAIHSGFWHGIETPQNCWEAHVDLLKTGFTKENIGIRRYYEITKQKFFYCAQGENLNAPWQQTGPSFVAPDVVLHPSSIVGGNTVVSRHVKVGAGTHIENSVILEGVELGPNEIIRDCVVGLGVGGKVAKVPIAV